MKLQGRKWKNFISKLILNEVDFAYYMFKQADEDYRSEIRRLKSKELTQQEIADCISPWEADAEINYDEYKEIRSRKWQREAIKISVPLHPHPYKHDVDDPTGHWEFLGSLGAWVLTDKGIHYIRREIREAQKAEHERRLRWAMPVIPVLALIVSIISVSSTCAS